MRRTLKAAGAVIMKKNFLLSIFIVTILLGLLIAAETVKKEPVAREKVKVWIGIRVLPLNQSLADTLALPYQRGLLVREVLKDSPADIAGIQAGDIIRNIGDRTIVNTTQLKNILAKKLAGQKIRVIYVRKRTTRTVYLYLEEALEEIAVALNTHLVNGTYPAAIPPTNSPYPYFYFGDDGAEGQEYPE